MSYALVQSGAIVKEAGRPTDLVRISDGAKVLWSAYITEAELNACGWWTVVDTPRPADTATDTFDRTVQLVGPILAAKVPTVVWVQRAKTQAELDAQAAQSNDATIRQQALTALADNRSFLAIASPTNAQTLAQVRALTRQANGLMRLALGKLDGVD